MENRILLIGDELFGDQGEAANRFTELLLCTEANRPIQFFINAPVILSISQLTGRASSDIIGKRAGRMIFGLGLRELRRSADANLVFEQYAALADEVLGNTMSPVHFLTIPAEALPQAPEQAGLFNQLVMSLEQKNPKRVKVFDFALHAEQYKEKQMERGKFGRSLFTEKGAPTSLCNMLLALYLHNEVLKEIK